MNDTHKEAMRVEIEYPTHTVTLEDVSPSQIQKSLESFFGDEKAIVLVFEKYWETKD